MNTQHSAGPKDREPGATGPSTESIEPVSAKPDRPSLPQIAAGALTAVSATALLSLLGVWGTIFGMGLLSVLTVLGNYMYSSFIHRTTQKVKHARPLHPAQETKRIRQAGSAYDDVVPAGPATITLEQPVAADPHDAAGAEGEKGAASRLREAWGSMVQRYGRRRIVVSIATVFVLLAGAVTVIELASGRPMADIVRGDQDGSGTSLFGGRASEDSETGDSGENEDSGGTGERGESPGDPNPGDQEDQQDQPSERQQPNEQPPAEEQQPGDGPGEPDQQDEQPPADESNPGDGQDAQPPAEDPADDAHQQEQPSAEEVDEVDVNVRQPAAEGAGAE